MRDNHDHQAEGSEETATRPHLFGLVGIVHPASTRVLALVLDLRLPTVAVVVKQSAGSSVAPHTGAVACTRTKVGNRVEARGMVMFEVRIKG